MFGLTPDTIILLTVIAAFSQSIVLLVTLIVFYKNLVVLRQHNVLTIERFNFQSDVEKYDLTLKFADWIKSELSDYLPHVDGNVTHGFLSKSEIKEHFNNIAVNTIKLVKTDIVYKSLMIDEIKKLHIILDRLEDDNPMVIELKKLIVKSNS